MKFGKDLTILFKKRLALKKNDEESQKILNYNFKILHWIAIGLVILPAVVMGILIMTYSVNIPYWDQWNLMPQLLSLIHI